MAKIIQDKVLFYGGSLIMSLGILIILLFSFASDLENTPKEMITPLIVIVFGVAIVMLLQGQKFLKEGLQNKEITNGKQ